MQKEDWHEHLGRIIGGTITCGSMSAIAGVVWGLALGFDIATGAMWGGIIGGGIVFILSLGISRYATGGMMMMFGPPVVIAVVIGLVVWLIRTLIG